VVENAIYVPVGGPFRILGRQGLCMAFSWSLHFSTVAFLMLLSNLPPVPPPPPPWEPPEPPITLLVPPPAAPPVAPATQVPTTIEPLAGFCEDMPPPGRPINSGDVKFAPGGIQMQLADPDRRIEAVLNEHHGYVAFSSSVEEGRLEFVLAAPNWQRVDIIGSYVPAENYCSFTVKGNWPLLARIAAQKGIAHISWSYIAFDRTMCRAIRNTIREFAGGRGIGCVRCARLRFASGGVGFSVGAIGPCEAEPGAGAPKVNR